MGIVFIYAVMGGMKGITYTQIAQYCVLIFAYTVPAVFIAFQLTGNPIPQLALGSTLSDGSGMYLLEKLNKICIELGFASYTAPEMVNIERVSVDHFPDGRHGGTAPCGSCGSSLFPKCGMPVIPRGGPWFSSAFCTPRPRPWGPWREPI